MKVAVRNAADRDQVRKADRKVKDREELWAEDMRAVCSTVSGRRFLYRILEETNVYGNSFTGNSETFFNEGKRRIGIWLIQQIEQHDRRAYLTMLGERIEDEGE